MYIAPGPAYACASWADHVLSDVRPIKLSPEALHSVNALLDEFLYNMLSAGQSLATDKLKNALGRVLPTNLGKEALLEAEVELKAYWERTTSAAPASASDEGERFDLQWAFEIMRLKCEAYSTMNDTDEDADAEQRLNERMQSNSGSYPPLQSLLAPAALYLTAILESTCEHILQNVSRVAARDSSRTTASVHDLFVALGEDDAIYGMFRAMKVYDQIETLSLTQEHKPRRSKSFSRGSANEYKLGSPPRTASPFEGGASSSRLRISSESVRSGTHGGERGSVDKGRMKKLMSHSRSSSEKDAVPALAASESGRSRASAEFEDDDELAHEFDELMRSGTTVKVSLTPDRLKSMEVYNKDRTQRANGRRGQREHAQHSDRETEEKAMYAAPATPEQKRTMRERPSLRHVDSIIEDDEESPQPHTPPPAYVVDPTRSRQASFASTTTTSTTTLPVRSSSTSIRNRSISISDAPHPKHDSLSRRTGSSTPVSSAHMSQRQQNGKPLPPVGQPQRTRKKQRNRESIDLDDILNVSDDEAGADEFGQISAQPQTAFPAKEPSTPRSRSSRADKPHVSQSARDLIAFLDEGPPEEPSFPHSITGNASVLSFESSKSKSGRFSSMMSRLTIGGSREKLNGAAALAQNSVQQFPRSLGRKPSKSNAPPPPTYLTQSLSNKRSMPNVTVVTPPRLPHAPSPIPNFPLPPPLKVPNPTIALAQQGSVPPATAPAHTTTTPVSAASGPGASPTSSQISFVPSPSMLPGEMSPRRSIRKAVPMFEDGERRNSQNLPVSPPPIGRSPSPRVSNGQANGYFDGSKAAEPDKAGRDDFAPVITRVRSKRSLGTGSTLNAPSTDSPSISRASSNVSMGKPKSKSARNTPSPVEAPKPAPPPTVTATEVDAFRGMLAGATSADECRLLVDMFFARHGFPFTDASRAAVASGTVIPAGGAYDGVTEASMDIEGSLVELFLGGGRVGDEDVSTPAIAAAPVVTPNEAPLPQKDVAAVLSEAKAAPDAVRAIPLVETPAPLVLAA